MKVKKTIKTKIMHLTKIKQRLLKEEYYNLQRFLHGESVKLYSANKQQAKRFYKKIKPDKEYPISVRKDLLKVERRRDTKIAKYWARIPVAGRRGGVWVAVKPHCPIELDMEICESKLFKRNGEFYLHITVQKEVEVPKPELAEKTTVVIACDIGEANPLVSVELWDQGKKRKNAQFLGGEMRSVRAHYNHLKKRIGRKKIKHAINWIKEHVANKETRKVNDILHKATTKIVDRALMLKRSGYEPVIVFGDLKNVRQPRVKGKRRCRKTNRKIHTMPSYKIKQMLTYKALWEEVPVIALNEAYTSKLCWRCRSLNTEIRKRCFRCKDCGLEYNRDLNGAINIGNRLLGYMLKSRAAVNTPKTSPEYTALLEKRFDNVSEREGGSPLQQLGVVHPVSWIIT
ncbi:MAG: RNA-guided endonuclease InsQ/TnpB family protein [Candidatus Wukongarchaeota archaeon]|nr:transposase [Candidatus Wukongarchaeota archaeon]